MQANKYPQTINALPINHQYPPSPPTDIHMVLFNFSGILTSVQEDEAVCGREAFNTQRGRKEVDVVGGAVRMISNVLGYSEQRRGPSRCRESVRTMKR